MNNVDQSEVVGVRGQDDYEKTYAFVLLNENITVGKEAIKKEILEICSDNLSNASIPCDIQFLEKFPIKPSGKRDMEQLKEMAARLLKALD